MKNVQLKFSQGYYTCIRLNLIKHCNLQLINSCMQLSIITGIKKSFKSMETNLQIRKLNTMDNVYIIHTLHQKCTCKNETN